MPRASKKVLPPVRWSSRTTFVVAAIGAVIGFNDFTQFPYLVAHYGGSAFLVVYFFGVVFIALPFMAAELLVGRQGRGDPVAGFGRLAAESGRCASWRGLGSLLIAGGFMAATYFSVVASWMAGYLVRVAANVFGTMNTIGAGQVFSVYVRDPERQLFWFTAFVLVTMVTSGVGIKRGVERVTPWVLGAALLVFAGLIGYGQHLDPSGTSAALLFNPDFTKLTPRGIIVAIGHAFYGLSLGTGALYAYGSYLPDEVPIFKWAFLIALTDIIIGALAGLVIYPVSLAAGLKAGLGPTLIFATLPVAFDHLPGGPIAGALFFGLLIVVAWTAAVAFVEPAVLWVTRARSCTRAEAARSVGLGLWTLGAAGIVSLNYWSFSFPFFGQERTLGIFDVLSIAAFDVLLPAASLALALFLGWIIRRDLTEKALRAISPCVYEMWLWGLRIIAPALLVFILFHLKRLDL